MFIIFQDPPGLIYIKCNRRICEKCWKTYRCVILKATERRIYKTYF